MIREIIVKSILNKKKKRDSWFLDEYTVNAYEGCSMNCLYCYVRGSKYGENMAEHLSVKINAAEILEKQLILRSKKGEHGFIVMSSATDPYMPVDAKYGMTRKFLSLFLRYQFPVHVITKSDLVLNDIDLIKQIDSNAIIPLDLKNKINHGAIISFSFSTLDETLSNRIESGAPSPARRLMSIKKLSEAGILTGVNLMPLLPGLSDNKANIEEMISSAADHGAHYVLAAGLTLFGNNEGSSKIMMTKYISKYHPQLEQLYSKIYSTSDYPSYDYNSRLYDLIRETCTKYKISNTIL